MNKLKKIIKRDEQKALEQSRSLYNSLTEELYPRAEKEQKPKRLTWLAPVVSGACALSIAFLSVGAYMLSGLFGTKDKNNAPQAAEIEMQAVGEDTFANSLVATRLADGLKFKEITMASLGGEAEYFNVKVDAVNTLDMVVKINPQSSVQVQLPPENARKTTVNGFEVTYSEVRKSNADHFVFSCTARVLTDVEEYYIVYKYSSYSPDCELLDVIEYFIKPKEGAS